MKVVKRDGKIVDFDEERIRIAIGKANEEVDDEEKATDEEINDIVNAFRTNIELEEKFRDDNFAILKERFELCRKGKFYE